MPVVRSGGPGLPDSIARTYRTLRVGLGAVALAFPVVLAVAGLAVDVPLQASMSAYYDTPLRDVFVGVLFAVGVALFLYQGFSRQEDWALNAAGVLAVLVALVPSPADSRYSPHGTFAVAFFVCLAYVAIFRSKDTLVLIDNEKRLASLRKTYRALGVAMAALPIAAFGLVSLLEFDRDPDMRRVVFFVEAAAIYAFGLFWLVKSHEIRETQKEQEQKPHGLRLA